MFNLRQARKNVRVLHES